MYQIPSDIGIQNLAFFGVCFFHCFIGHLQIRMSDVVVDIETNGQAMQ